MGSIVSNDHALADPVIFPPSHLASEGLTSQVTRVNRISSQDTGQAYPSTSLLPEGVDGIHGSKNQQKSRANAESGVTGSSNLDPKLMGRGNGWGANPLIQNPARMLKKAKVSRSYGSYSSIPNKSHDQVKGNVLSNSEGLSDKYVQSDKAPETNQPIRRSFLVQHKPITKLPEYSFASAFPALHSSNFKRPHERSGEIEADLPKLATAIFKLHELWEQLQEGAPRPKTGWNRRALTWTRTRLESSFILFFDMHEGTQKYLGVKSSAKADEGKMVELRIDRLYNWWENCWKDVRFLPMTQISKSEFIQFYSSVAEPIKVLEVWYTSENWKRLGPLCAAWLVIKWMQSKAFDWFEELQKMIKDVHLPHDRSDDWAGKLVKGLRQNDLLRYQY
ncbi:hypothetical protein CROQUDRAFT_102032 [Cronartium quercuum f. sp. fusiforme G11]|uniref:Uncharacterized protein n=1 Tax=Cronartium quercuum f. sp. fusiforme G11 TaxID=708437 RepID=A0A9P6N503_9BASI|nr:hypothetical protein CROQUDRAFT_102032 [Cronartium quercuum f. sp. fusiforme G11]